MRFKKGDKVKIVKFTHRHRIGQVGTIIETYFAEFPETMFPYRVKVGCWNCPMMESELEPVAKVGEQLLLFEP